ncbi:GntR family transcriptional regulator [Mycolicibacterium fluoranthenivorans]|uniref:GntR family transcriptional regulator n=1 Tax=Mycolicibacterium fluoranthenivorans TaxID=258505 RepID=A0A7G8PHP5_9MYCO|nr:GntR family transcriptional regulator [Mycolicibacterium fluoranthenivorans]QNJ93861.1 GntR family transcriptional regulator [Mycolicibacterium fluoranthenivorans]
MDVQPIQVSTLGDEVYRQLRTAITAGTAAPGTKISIRSLADAFSVSTMPVREALRRLESDGLVVFGRRAITVSSLTADQVTQVFRIRLQLETLATEWAIERVADDDITDLRDILARMDRDDIKKDEWRVLNQDFHRRFYDCARSPDLLDLIGRVWDKVEPYMAIYASRVDDFTEAHRQHVEILDAIAARDTYTLLLRNAEHSEYTSRTVTTALEQKGRA